jgi:crotonobetainyl-CoA:carnitine CoA-transferase CaiB-like acyl-CoA transferase
MISKHSSTSMGSEARRILDTELLNNKSLGIPNSIIKRLSTTQFAPADALPVIPTPCKISESAAALWALVGLFAAKIHEDRYGADQQDVHVDLLQATLFPFSTFLFEINGKGIWDPSLMDRCDHMDLGRFMEPYRGLATNIYRTADDRYFHLHGGLNTTATLHMLDLPQHRPDLTSNDKEAIKDIYRHAVGQKHSQWLDIEANEHWRQAGTICYTAEEFRQTSHGKEVIKQPLYNIYNVQAELPKVSWPSQGVSKKPLSGIKILDLTRVVAGPTITKTLALLGADVLRISSRTVPEPSSIIFDMQHGKRDTSLNLKTTEGKVAFRALVEDADVIVDGYRPGSLERMGFGRMWVHEVAKRRGKGMIYARENCYGWTGEWSHRSGWQQISDCVSEYLPLRLRFESSANLALYSSGIGHWR